MTKLVPENHPALHTIAEEITPEEFSDGTVLKIVKSLREAIKTYDVDGYSAVAIASPQIGVSKRIFIIEDQSNDKEDERLPTIIAINPRFTKTSRKMQTLGEGCLSIPDTYGIVERHKNVTLEALDEKGNKFSRGAGGLLSQIMQHEYDHLDGILFPERAEKYWTKGNEPEEFKDKEDE